MPIDHYDRCTMSAASESLTEIALLSEPANWLRMSESIDWYSGGRESLSAFPGANILHTLQKISNCLKWQPPRPKLKTPKLVVALRRTSC